MNAWRAAPVDEATVSGLAGALGLRPLTARLMLGRGFSAQTGPQFLSPKLAHLRPPHGIADLDRALSRLQASVGRGERVGVFGDYDVDGVTTAAILTLTLRAFGVDVVPRVASRFSGYGLTPEVATQFCDEGCAVLVTGDCGTSDHAALALCRARGVDVIVIDHHQVPDGPSGAYALINPHRPDDRFPFKGLASCGVAFYLACALRTEVRTQGHRLAEGFDPRSLLDLVALGTLADMVPLVAENRILVTAGLRELSHRRRPGLRALCEAADIPPDAAFSPETVTFRLTPRLNAPGRLGEARPALDLLLAQGEMDARRLVAAVNDANADRQRIQEQVWTQAAKAAQIEVTAGRKAIVVGAEGWHPGVVGIVAAKLVEKFSRPAVVVGFRDGVGRGSGRTTGGFDLHRAFLGGREFLVAYGGHAAAAGLTVNADQVEGFREAFVASADQHFEGKGADHATPLDVDAIVGLDELDLPQIEELGRLGPFGNANKEPLFAIPGMVVQSTRIVGQRHLQLTVSHGRAVSDAIAFGMADRDPGVGAVLDVVAHADVDTFRGYRRPRLRVKDWLSSS